MNNTTSSIITIGREYGSAGRQIGQEVARYFGIKCYDKELLEHAANDSGICKELFENHDERPTNSFLYSLVMDTYSFGYSSAGFTDMPMNHKVFLAQFEAIKKLAAEGPCVMVGRCADYALADKSRASYYNYYTNKKWGAAAGYSLSVDSSVLGIEGAAQAIINTIHIFDDLKK